MTSAFDGVWEQRRRPECGCVAYFLGQALDIYPETHTFSLIKPSQIAVYPHPHRRAKGPSSEFLRHCKAIDIPPPSLRIFGLSFVDVNRVLELLFRLGVRDGWPWKFGEGGKREKEIGLVWGRGRGNRLGSIDRRGRRSVAMYQFHSMRIISISICRPFSEC